MHHLGPFIPSFAMPAIPMNATGMPMPMPSFGGGLPGMAFPAMQHGPHTPTPPERFISSAAGGVILDKDGAPAGRVPAGSFVDTKDGKVYGPDSKPLAIPSGSSVDFFDLPDVNHLVAMAGGGAVGPDKGAAAMPHPAVLGQWGPGGTTPIKGGAAGCEMDHAPGAHGIHAGHGGPMQALGGGPAGQYVPDPVAAQLQQLLSQAQQLGLRPALSTAYGAPIPSGTYPPGMPVGFNPTVHGGGLGTGVLGASGVGVPPSLQSALMELVATLGQLAQAVQAATSGGGASTAPTKAEPVPAKPEPSTAAAATPVAPASDSAASTSTTTSAATTTAVAGAAGGSTAGSDTSTSTESTSTEAPTKAT